jgi:uncharacterized protein
MDEQNIKKILLEHNKIVNKEIIKRNIYSKLENNIDNSFVIIISGIRRCGKSTLLKELKTDDYYYVNFDDDRFVNFSLEDFSKLKNILIELFGKHTNYIFDEIQNIVGWERFIRRLNDEGNKIFITGSNASMLSKELGTHLTGRHIMLKLFPFSFKEYLTFRKIDIKELNKLTNDEESLIKKYFNEYVQEGGFPEYLLTKNEDYLKTLFENILYRDIIVRHKLKSEKIIKECAIYSASNISKEISFNNLKKLTGLTSATTIKEYFEYFENSYLFFLINRYDCSLKKQIYHNKKIYVIDTAMSNLIGFKFSENIGRLVENIVFLELKRKDEEIYFNKNKYECDFLIKKEDKISSAIQVGISLKDEKTRTREINGLLEALQKFKLKTGLILSMDQEEEIMIEDKKIIIKPIWKWLLED